MQKYKWYSHILPSYIVIEVDGTLAFRAQHSTLKIQNSPINTEASSMDSNEIGHPQGENQKHLAAVLEDKVKTQIVRI